MNDHLSRRQLLQRTTQLGAASWLATTLVAPKSLSAETSPPLKAIRYCLNTSTIRGQKRPLSEEVSLVADAGYDGIEPWIHEIKSHVESGKSLRDLRNQINDCGLTVESAIGFAQWIIDDDAKRTAGLEQLKRDMDLVRQIGGTRIAAPPTGATQQTDLDLNRAAERYAKALELGQAMGVTPQLEVWGFSQSLSRLGEVMYVAIESGHQDACLLPDVYHLFKGGSDFGGLAMIAGSAIHVMHLNDYPDNLSRQSIKDSDRVYPGDGVAPLARIIRQLRANGFDGTFSLELFNPTYWQRPIEEVLATGLTRMKSAVAASDASLPE